MPPLTLKRKDPIVKAVRRNATRQLDAVIDSLTGPSAADPAAAHRDLVRLQSLLHLVRRPLGRDVFNRENRVVNRSLRIVTPTPPSPAETLRELAAEQPPIDAEALIAELAEDPPTAKRTKKNKPDPKLLRLVADLAEMRMRARYWHLPDGGFELIAPGLRQSYQQAAKLREADASPAAFADALARLVNQLAMIERAWPDLLGVTRKSLRSLERLARHQTALVELRPHVQDHATLLARVDQQLDELRSEGSPLRDQLFVETPAALTKRLAGVWDAWRD